MVDGSGQIAKIFEYSEMMSNKAAVTSSNDFAEVAAKTCQNIQIKTNKQS